MHAASTPNFLSAQALEANNNNAASSSPAAQPQHVQPPASYTSEEMAFHKLFPNVPLSEKLVESFQCGLSRKKIVRMGRMYLTSLRICFHSSFMKESVTIDWDQVIGVEKKSNFVFEAVIVEVNGGERHFFSAFMYGVTDQAHKLMTMLWTVRSKYGAAGAAAAGQQQAESEIAAAVAAAAATTKSVGAAPGSGQVDDDARVNSPAAEQAILPSPDDDTSERAGSDPAATLDIAGAAAAGGNRSSQPSPARVRPTENSFSTAAEATGRPSGGMLDKPQLRDEPRPVTPQQGPSKSRRNAPEGAASTAAPSGQEGAVPATRRAVTPPAQRPEPTTPDIFKHFPSISKSETVVDRFQCSYVSGVHRLGGLYITTNYILFHSVMMSEGVMIKFSDVSSIEKEQTIIILDGIVVTTKSGVSHSFTSFVSRDAAYNILVHFFGPHKIKAAKEKSIATAAAAAAAPPPPAAAAPNARTPPESPLSSPATAAGNVTPPPMPTTGSSSSIFRTTTSTSSFDSFPRVSSVNEFSKVQTDFGTGLSPVEHFVKQIVPDKDLPKGFSVIDVFKELFDDETSFLDEYHEQRQDTARTWEPWRTPLAGSPPSSGQRKLLCTTIIRAVFATACPFTEFQRYALMNVNGSPTLLVQLSGQAIGVMFADSFRAETLMMFTQNTATDTVTVRVMGHIQFLRNVWVKSKILSTALDVEMPDCYQTLTNMAIKRLSSSRPSAAGGPSNLASAVTAALPAVAAAPAAPATSAAQPLLSQPLASPQVASSPAAGVKDEGTVKHVTVALCLLGLFFSVRGLLSTLTFNVDNYFAEQMSAALCSSGSAAECNAVLSSSSVRGGELAAAMSLANAIVALFRPVVVASLCCTSVYFVGKLRNLLL